jgi:hypothetical protein
MAKRNAPIVQSTPAPAPGMGRLQAQAAYQAMPVEAAPVAGAAEAGAPKSASAPRTAMPPVAGGFGKGMAAYGKAVARG